MSANSERNEEILLTFVLLLANIPDVSVSDDNSGVVDRLSEVALQDNSLESSFQESVNGETQDVIQFIFRFIQDTHLIKLLHKGTTFENSFWVLLIEGEELSGSLSDLCQSKSDSPDFSLVFQTVFTDELQPMREIQCECPSNNREKLLLFIESFLFERSSRGVECGGTYPSVH